LKKSEAQQTENLSLAAQSDPLEKTLYILLVPPTIIIVAIVMFYETIKEVINND